MKYFQQILIHTDELIQNGISDGLPVEIQEYLLSKSFRRPFK